jgi:DNA-binding transcriptional LysR family regulator
MKLRIVSALALALLATGVTVAPASAAAPHNHGTALVCWRHLNDSPRPYWYASLCGGYWWAR